METWKSPKAFADFVDDFRASSEDVQREVLQIIANKKEVREKLAILIAESRNARMRRFERRDVCSPIEPEHRRSEDDIYKCSICQKRIIRDGYVYCPECGCQIDW
jgi:hypothetical protein